jgi:hypothetical protein
MAGLIQEQMMGEEPELEQEGMPQGAMPEEELPEEDEGEFDENEPNYQTALQYAMEALYGTGAAKDVSAQLKAAPGLMEGMANIAYDITATVDERTDGNVPDDMLVPLAMKILEEVVEIADASGLDPQPEDVALAFKTMILRYLQEQGLDTSQLDQAMSQVDPTVFRKAAEEEQAEEV